MPTKKIIIGRKDKIGLPELGLTDIDAKIDTGAYGCALHCHHIAVVGNENEKSLTFKLLDPTHPEYSNKIFTFTKFGDRVVKSSSGLAEHRYTITTLVEIFGRKHRVEFSLTDRASMKHPILLGRKFLNKKYIVDVQLKNVSFEMKSQ